MNVDEFALRAKRLWLSTIQMQQFLTSSRFVNVLHLATEASNLARAYLNFTKLWNDEIEKIVFRANAERGKIPEWQGIKFRSHLSQVSMTAEVVWDNAYTNLLVFDEFEALIDTNGTTAEMFDLVGGKKRVDWLRIFPKEKVTKLHGSYLESEFFKYRLPQPLAMEVEIDAECLILAALTPPPYLGLVMEDDQVKRVSFPNYVDLSKKPLQRELFKILLKELGRPITSSDLEDMIYGDVRSSSALPNLRISLSKSLDSLGVEVDKNNCLVDMAKQTKKIRTKKKQV